MSALEPNALFELARQIYRRAFVEGFTGERPRAKGLDLPNGEYTLDELAKLLAAQADGYRDGMECRSIMTADSEPIRCSASIHPGTERSGSQCVLLQGHSGDHKK